MTGAAASRRPEHMPAYSLLHATFRAGERAVAVRQEWLAAADDPSTVEHVFAADRDDEISMACPQIRSGVIGEPMTGVSAVRNWNAAAAASTGALLVVIADDLHPCPGWDSMLRAVVSGLDPRRVPFVVNVADSEGHRVHRISHPVVSRRYFERFGLWHPEYTGHFVDNDFTLVAHAHGLVLDGREITFRHENHHGRAPTESQARMAGESYDQGMIVFSRRFPSWRRRLRVSYFHPRAGQASVSEARRIWRCATARAGYLKPFMPKALRRRLRRGPRTS